MHGGVRISTTTQCKSIYVIFEQLVMFAFPLSVTLAGPGLNRKMSSAAPHPLWHFIKRGQANGSEGRDSHELT